MPKSFYKACHNIPISIKRIHGVWAISLPFIILLSKTISNYIHHMISTALKMHMLA